MDNGPELTAYALRDWARFTGTGTACIDPGSPWQNGRRESFNGRFRDEFLATEQLDTLTEAQVLAEDWRVQHLPTTRFPRPKPSEPCG
jgi:IS30 family transposase